MEFSFDSHFFIGNRQHLRELFTGTAPIVITANGLLQRGADSTFAFAQDASFWYLTGVDDPDIVLLIDRDKEYLIVPSRSDSREAFDGSIDLEYLSKRSGISNVVDDKTGWELIASRLRKVKHVATIAAPPTYIESYGLYTNPARFSLIQRLKLLNSELELLDLSSHLSRLRSIKQPVEIATIQRAIAITSKAIKAATTPVKLKKYHAEYELEAELSRSFRKQGASGHAFEPIVASGPRACVLHNVKNNGTFKAGELVVVDTGAEVNHYAADITRTFSVGQPSKRQVAVFEAVSEVQAFALSLLKPGTMLKDYEIAIEHFMGEKLRELGLLKTISHETVRMFYPHATSHFLGLNVHDTGDYDRPLEAGMVLTVEPGIYIEREGIGIRIEDDVLITAKKHKVLSASLPSKLA